MPDPDPLHEGVPTDLEEREHPRVEEPVGKLLDCEYHHNTQQRNHDGSQPVIGDWEFVHQHEAYDEYQDDEREEESELSDLNLVRDVPHKRYHQDRDYRDQQQPQHERPICRPLAGHQCRAHVEYQCDEDDSDEDQEQLFDAHANTCIETGLGALSYFRPLPPSVRASPSSLSLEVEEAVRICEHDNTGDACTRSSVSIRIYIQITEGDCVSVMATPSIRMEL